MVNIELVLELGRGTSGPWLDNSSAACYWWGNTSVETDSALPSQRAWLHLDSAQPPPHPLHTAHCSGPKLPSSLLGTLWQSPQVTEPASEILISTSQGCSSTSYVSQRQLFLEDITVIPVFYCSVVV